MTSTRQKIWSRAELLDLLDDRDVVALWEKWKLAPSERMSKEAAEFVATLDARSNTTLLRDVLSLRTATLQMLRDVLTFLAGRHSAARTTGSLLVLDEEFELAPQEVNAVLRWSDAVLQRHSATTWEELRQTFRDDVRPLFKRVEAYGEVQCRSRSEDLIDYVIRKKLHEGSRELRRFVTVEYDETGLKSREGYITKLAELAAKVEGARNRCSNAVARALFRDITELCTAQQAHLARSHDDIASAHYTAHGNAYHERLTDRDHEIWRCFAEGVLFLSDTEESGMAVDVLRMDLFRNRPQLFELWIVVAIIRSMQRIGYEIDMLNVHTNAAGRVVWKLNYSKARTPICRFTRGSDGTQFFLFYQLFRPGTARAEMPDLALMPSERGDGDAAWVLDPKHSERGGYSRRSYEEVGRRYHAAFSPRRTWIVEYYPRPGLGADGPVALAEGVELIRDVSPEGGGYVCLCHRLREFHGSGNVTMAIVDVSQSFRSHLDRVIQDLRDARARGVVLSDDIIWFSDEAAVNAGSVEALAGATLAPPPGLADRGTRFGPVVDLVERLSQRDGAYASLRIYTDGRFTDVQMADAVERLQHLSQVEIIDF